MDHLDRLENKSIYIIREAYKKFGNLTGLWSFGKDSTVIVWLCRKAFFGKVPFPLMHIDTTFKFPEMYQYRDEFIKKWDLKFIRYVNHEALGRGVNYDNCDALTCCEELKTNALKKAIQEYKIDGLLVGIRKDEEGSRSKERYFSPRSKNFTWDYKNQPPELWDQFKTTFPQGTHVRVHPLLDWTELDIWLYIQRENIPVVSLYFAKDGKRFRSLGCMPITKPVPSRSSNVPEIIEELKTTQTTERSGRSQDSEQEYALQKLRAKGYM
jgi:sulfate adenylyltransferase subunit 2